MLRDDRDRYFQEDLGSEARALHAQKEKGQTVLPQGQSDPDERRIREIESVLRTDRERYFRRWSQHGVPPASGASRAEADEASRSMRSTDRKLDPRLWRNSVDTNNWWFVQLPQGFSYDDVLRPAFWSDVERSNGSRIGEFDIVRIRARDGSFDGLFTVIGRASGGLQLEFLAGRKPAPTT